MRVSDFAKKYHLSEQAVRGRIKRAGYSLEDLRQPGSNQFSPEGEQIVSELFGDLAAAPAAAPEAPARGSGRGKGKSQASGSGEKLALIRAERDELKIRTAAAESLAAERQKTIDFLQQQIREKDSTIAGLVAAAAVRAALPEPQATQPTEQPGKRKKSILERMLECIQKRKRHSEI